MRQCIDERLIGLRVGLVELCRRRRDDERRRAAKDLVGIEHLVDPRVFELEILEWRRREVAVDLADAREQRGHRVGMAQRNREVVERAGKSAQTTSEPWSIQKHLPSAHP